MTQTLHQYLAICKRLLCVERCNALVQLLAVVTPWFFCAKLAIYI